MTLIQKGVQARILAQTFTLILILGAMAATYVNPEDKAAHHPVCRVSPDIRVLRPTHLRWTSSARLL